MLKDNYIEEVAQILYDMQLTIDEAEARLVDPLPAAIRLSPPVLSFKDSKVVPYAENTFDIMESDKKLGTLHFNQIGPSTYQLIVRVGKQQRHSTVASLKNDPEEIANHFRLMLRQFFPNHLIQI